MGGGNLFIKLLKLKKTHQRTQILYKDFISLYPHLKYPPLEQCSDYKEALKYKFHLSYLLGSALIKANKTWYKGGYIKFYFYEIQKAKQTYQEFKALDEEHILESHYLTLIFENKDKLKFFKEHKGEFKTSLKNLLEVFDDNQQEKILNILFSYPSLKDLFIFFKDFKTLLNDFNHYEALSISLKQAIAYDLIFFTQNFNIIKEWLYSKEFKQNYQDKNHPYPSLLNPEKIDYENIPAELAWEMNLPLPPYYDMIYLLSHGVGVAKVRETLFSLGLRMPYSFHIVMQSKKAFEIYNFFFHRFLSNKNHPCLGLELSAVTYRDLDNFYKLLALVDKKVPFFCQVRDPIEVLTHGFKRRGKWVRHLLVKKKEFNLNSHFDDIIVDIEKSNYALDLEDLKNPKSCFPSMIVFKVLLKALEKNISVIEFLDTKELNSAEVIPIMQRIAKNLGLTPPCEEHKKILQANIFKGSAYLFLPLTFNLSSSKKDFSINLRILGIGPNKLDVGINPNEFDLYEEICHKTSNQIGVYIPQQDLEDFRSDTEIYQATCNYLKDFIEKLEARMELEDKKALKIDDVMEYFRKEPLARKHIKSLLDEEVAIINKYRPDIVTSWKYYQEFEKMCEDGG
ncbi:MAG: DUF2972 domain-containing protein [Helicobacter sp.]|nr:DUF2972 domain-containing protein [Helicobacter sp.]